MSPLDSIAAVPADVAVLMLKGLSSGCGSPFTPPDAVAADAAPLSAAERHSKPAVLMARTERRTSMRPLLTGVGGRWQEMPMSDSKDPFPYPGSTVNMQLSREWRE